MRALHPRRDKHPRTPPPSRLSRVVLALFVIVSLAGVFAIMRPFVAPIVLGLLLVSLFHPMHRRISRRFGKHHTLAAVSSVSIISLLVIVPVVLFSLAIVQQGVDVFRRSQAWIEAGHLDRAMEHEKVQAFLERPAVQKARAVIGERLPHGDDADGKVAFGLAGKLMELSGVALDFVRQRVFPVVTGTGLLLMNFLIMLFVMFYAFRDGETMLAYILLVLPLSHSHERLLIERIHSIARAIVVGTLLTSTVQGLVGMIGFRIVGIPAFFWGVVLGVASLIPIVGTALVWLPASIYLLIMGRPGAAAFLCCWGVLVVGSIDNFLRPLFMQGNSGMSTVVLFFALVGGIKLFGMVGLVYGPLIFGICAVVLYIYRVENSDLLLKLEAQ